MDDALVGLACLAVPIIGILSVIGLVRLVSGSGRREGSEARIDTLQLEIDALKRQSWALHDRLQRVEQEPSKRRDRGPSMPTGGGRSESRTQLSDNGGGSGTRSRASETDAVHGPRTTDAVPVDGHGSRRRTPVSEAAPAPDDGHGPGPGRRTRSRTRPRPRRQTRSRPRSRTRLAAPAPAPAPVPEDSPEATSGSGLEQWIGVRGAAALGGVVLVIAGLYFFQYSIEHGWLTPLMRVILGVALGAGLVAGSELRLRRSHAVLANWLDGAGVAILYTAFWAGAALYDLYPTLVAAALMIVVTGLCCALSLLRKATPIAFLGLVGGFLTPMALSSGEDRPFALFGYLLGPRRRDARHRAAPSLAGPGAALPRRDGPLSGPLDLRLHGGGALRDGRGPVGPLRDPLRRAAAPDPGGRGGGGAPDRGPATSNLEDLTRLGALAVPSLFVFAFSIKGALAEHWLTTGLLILSLNVGALVLARVAEDGRLPLLAAVASVVVFLAAAQRESLPFVAAWGGDGLRGGDRRAAPRGLRDRRPQDRGPLASANTVWMPGSKAVKRQPGPVSEVNMKLRSNASTRTASVSTGWSVSRNDQC